MSNNGFKFDLNEINYIIDFQYTIYSIHIKYLL